MTMWSRTNPDGAADRAAREGRVVKFTAFEGEPFWVAVDAIAGICPVSSQSREAVPEVLAEVILRAGLCIPIRESSQDAIRIWCGRL